MLQSATSRRHSGKFKALDSVSLEIAQGSFTTLLGPSGCGKTTLLRSIAGFYQIDEGEISIDAASSTAFHPNCATRSWCSRTTRSSPHDHKGKHHLRAAHPKNAARRNRAQARKDVHYLDIGMLLDRMPGQISGGQQQRVGPCARPSHGA